MNKIKKGYRSEVKAQKFYEKLGFKVQRTHRSKFSDNDFFGLFDLMYLSKDEHPVFVQVKSNSVKKSVIKELAEFMSKWKINIEVLVIKDRGEPIRYLFSTPKIIFKKDYNKEYGFEEIFLGKAKKTQ